MYEISSKVSSKPTENHGSNSDSHSILITTIRLNGNNFLCWSQSVRMYIRGRGKIGYLTGDTKAPDLKDTTYTTWDAENSMVMAWLVNAMDEAIASNYMSYPTAKELWDNIHQMYSDRGNQSISPKCTNCSYNLKQFDKGEIMSQNTLIVWRGCGKS